MKLSKINPEGGDLTANAMRYYIAVIHQERTSDCTLSFPDFPGCTTTGRGLDDAISSAVIVLQRHVDALVQNGDPVPEPSSFETAIRENRDGVFTLVRCTLRITGQSVRSQGDGS